jgi:hypothetical protein
VFTGILAKFVFTVTMIIKPNIRYAIIMLLIGILAVGCLKRKEYSTTPQITYNSFQLFQNVAGNDSVAFLQVSYTDGDGNIGLSQGDTLAPYTGQFYYNCFVEYYELQNGVWVKPVLNPPFYYRIPPLNDNEHAIEGTIDIRLNAPFVSPSAFDTIKYSITIADRALNLSNTVETPVFIK